jgi:hypothetical protein
VLGFHVGGVNLQEASAVVHLDMPSVVRIAEQRVGRVDRMDSPHASIQVWWPQDAKEFALRSDERFLERYATVESLLGSNMPLPEALGGSGGGEHGAVVSAKAMIRNSRMPTPSHGTAFGMHLRPSVTWSRSRSVSYRWRPTGTTARSPSACWPA